ncbi:hypothetical protein HanPI659440_Chr16g0659841 [Helianthus annuus]|nr:hypothetical protein HanPI659440_Chr16g0659841 [Helianthus annuus]
MMTDYLGDSELAYFCERSNRLSLPKILWFSTLGTCDGHVNSFCFTRQPLPRWYCRLFGIDTVTSDFVVFNKLPFLGLYLSIAKKYYFNPW